MPCSLLQVVIAADPPSRLDKALARDAPAEAHLSRSRIARLIAGGAVTSGGAVVLAPTRRPAAGELYEIAVPAAVEADVVPQAIPLAVVYEDGDLMVVDKPAGMVVHPAAGSPDNTLVNALLHRLEGRLSGVGGVMRPGIVHRIDKDTSGLVVVAKSDRAHHALAARFAAHDVERSYLAVCHGIPDAADPRLRGLRGVSVEPEGTLRIATRLGRHRTDRQRQSVLQGQAGRHAVSRLSTTRRFAAGAALLQCRLETGRTHQIRVHAAYIGHPLVGDPVYGGRRRFAGGLPGAELANAFPRQALHAATLGFDHPVTGRRLRFVAPLPLDLGDLIGALEDSQTSTIQ